MNKIVSGALAGFGATVPMTASMIGMHRLLPRHERYALPPRKVTMNVAKAVDVKKHLSEPQRKAATIAAHFGYGAAMGAIFRLLAPRAPGPPVAKGILWGLIVWSSSYLGLLPALDLHESAKWDPRERNILMILAHVIWGASLGLFLSRRVR